MKRLLFSLVFCLCLPLGSAGANVASPIRETLGFGHIATFSEFCNDCRPTEYYFTDEKLSELNICHHPSRYTPWGDYSIRR